MANEDEPVEVQDLDKFFAEPAPDPPTEPPTEPAPEPAPEPVLQSSPAHFERKYGFMQNPDDRDFAFPLSAAKKPHLRFKRSIIHNLGIVLDQEDSASCVGHAWAHFIAAGPTKNNDVDPYAVYMLAQELDEFDGQEPEFQGTSLRGGAKAVCQMGLIGKKYLWTKDPIVVWDCLTSRAPVLLGTPWYEGMEKVDGGGNVELTGSNYGGHAYLAIGGIVENKSFLCVNSYGRDWGVQGRFYLTFDQLQELFDQGGVACSALEI